MGTNGSFSWSAMYQKNEGMNYLLVMANMASSQQYCPWWWQGQVSAWVLYVCSYMESYTSATGRCWDMKGKYPDTSDRHMITDGAPYQSRWFAPAEGDLKATVDVGWDSSTKKGMHWHCGTWSSGLPNHHGVEVCAMVCQRRGGRSFSMFGRVKTPH
jgi:hypothetical protein